MYNNMVIRDKRKLLMKTTNSVNENQPNVYLSCLATFQLIWNSSITLNMDQSYWGPSFKVLLWWDFYPLIFQVHRIEFYKRFKTPFTVYKHLHWFWRYCIEVWKMTKICKCDDWWRHTLNQIIHQVYINSPIFVNLQQKPLKLGRPIVLNATHPQPLRLPLPWQPTLFQSLQPDFNILVVLSLEDMKQGHELNLMYLNACWIMQMTHHWQ